MDAWSEHVDEGSGRSYFYNAATGETMWERPAGMLDPEQEAVMASPSTAQPEHGWTEHFDEGSSRTYYYNTLSGETAWERPAEMDAQPAAFAEALVPADDSGWEEIHDATSSTTYYYNRSTGQSSWERPPEMDNPVTAVTAVAAVPAVPADAAPITSIWTEHLDPSSGKEYFVNSQTGETQWERPPELMRILQRSAGSMSNFVLPEGADDIGVGAGSGAGAGVEGEPDDSLGMSLYSSAALTNTPTPSHLTPIRNKMSNFIAPPSEFANDPTQLLGASSSRDDGTTIISDSIAAAVAAEERSIYGTAQQESELQTALEAIGRIKFPEASSEQVAAAILAIPRSQFSSLQCMMEIGAKLVANNFRFYRYAELHFQYDTKLLSTNNNILHKLISHQQEPLTSSLSHMPAQYVPMALESFSLIQQFMQARTVQSQLTPSSSPGMPAAAAGGGGGGGAAAGSLRPYDIAQRLLFKLLYSNIQDVVDEVFAQLMKQLKSNCHPEQVELGWQLLLVLLSSLPPSRKLYPFLLAYIYSQLQQFSTSGGAAGAVGGGGGGGGGGIGPGPIAANCKRFVVNCLQIVTHAASHRIRKEVPTEREVTLLLLNEPMEVLVYTIDYTHIRVFVNSFTTVSALRELVFKDLRIADANRRCFELFQCRNNQSSQMNPQDRVVDVLAKWDKHSSSSSSSAASSSGPGSSGATSSGLPATPRAAEHPVGVQSRFHFLVKLFLFLPLSTNPRDPVAECLLFKQCVENVLRATVPLTLQDYMLLNALYLQHVHGDYVSGKDYPVHYNLYHNAQHVLCPHVASALDQPDAAMSKSELEHRTLLLYKKMMGVSKTQAQVMYVTFLQSNRLFGAAYYPVHGNSVYSSSSGSGGGGGGVAGGGSGGSSNGGGSSGSDDLLLAVTSKAVVVVDQQCGAYLAEHFYCNIYSCTHSFDAFILVVGTKASHVKHYFRTPLGQEMEELINMYCTFYKSQQAEASASTSASAVAAAATSGSGGGSTPAVASAQRKSIFGNE